MKRALYVVAMAVLSAAVQAETLTAVCNDPTGYDYRVPVDQRLNVTGMPDGFKGVAWSFSWVVGEPMGTAIVQNSQSAGSAPAVQKGPVVFASEAGIVSFIVPMTEAIWVYSIYPAAKVMMASRHTHGLPEDGAVGSIFHAKCAVAIK